ncbi:endonuclease [Candidatus Desantisbacteria bacterium CG_4_10_14_0_8_um_filter_48_22]|uniref:Endonuclease n=1 Tax=Candidatus Desantisbacteria bacterium CG_4_10_14_0_8_um_filter_48_22 TaxID=1974543 RepID=A0A2M7SE17_9BACT|nr:MAG: endonuclease [Candidatus Desantisbacteria bacterium CG1_02_49_89]PIV54920.1 MAG: endonuclease [Candidatus Desantisbacteria bacterium CG02_land_8_20_14_3_00_49_13]PIZ17721.1 MAG: endonuclease [Candidatus Desantisbacteria bacterium CG_4_10_14_0_8_um_filter_48_22]PJB28778.1 MAG: endonuclease [Candidatus Desantisbacteria bacterium CG_4_9_14_3_um_filter_50_7]
MLLRIYRMLLKCFGRQDWWPAKTRFEVMVGAILTQNTNWKNVEKAIANLRKAGALTPEKMSKLTRGTLRGYIRPSGFYRQKAERLAGFLDFLKGYGYDLSKLFSGDPGCLRIKLLQLKGIGPETADSIMLYAGNKPFFVVDAYTKRIFARLGLIADSDEYEEVRKFFQDNLPRKTGLYNEYHALIVELAKKHCRKEPVCGGCPLAKQCKFEKKYN